MVLASSIVATDAQRVAASRGAPVIGASVERLTHTNQWRCAMPSQNYGLPEEKKYPMPDKAHARNAKARASQQVKAGNLTRTEKAKIDRKADRMLDKKR
jgi:hypothetical protein